MTKICTKCNIKRNLSEFYKRKDRPSGVKSECKICNANRNKIYRKENCEELKLKRKEYVTLHHEEIIKKDRIRGKIYYINNRDRVLKRTSNNNKKNKYWKRLKITTYVRYPWRFSKRYRKWVSDIYKKFNYTCQHCSKTHCVVHAHHIKSAKDYPELRYDINNGICLCEACHRAEHRQPNFIRLYVDHLKR